MKKNGFQFYLLVIISPGLGIAPPAPQGLSYPPRERTLPRTTIHDSLQQLFHPFLIIISSSPFSVCLPSLGDNLHRVLVPFAKSAHNQRNEYDSLCLASFTVFPHFDIEGMLDSICSFPGDLSSKLLLKRIDNRDVKGSIFAISPEGEQDISRAVIAAREKPRRLFPRTQGCLKCSCKENEMVDKK